MKIRGVSFSKKNGISTMPLPGADLYLLEFSDETHSQKLRDDVRLATPLRAREIKKLLEYDLVFLKTLTPVRNGQKILNAIKNSER